MAHTPDEHDGRQALGEHIAEKAGAARLKYGLCIDADAILRMLDDRQVVRYPSGLRFDSTPLWPGEFGYAMPLGEHPREGFCLFIHPCFEHQRDIWPLLIAYHIPPINYGDIASAEDCELFGATLMGLEPEAYYQALCELSDSIPAPASVTDAPAGSAR